MEALLKIDKDKCIVCYACVRACPVKAIRVQSDKVTPEIIPERCIGCGSCVASCSPGAIDIRDSRANVKKLLKGDRACAALVDPSIAGEFPDISDYRKFVQMLRVLGFKYVNEVAFGADLVALAYKHLFGNAKGKYYIMSNDPVTVSFVQKYRPSLIHNLAPIAPPAVATARVLRKHLKENLAFVYISPLISSKEEILDFEQDDRIDEVITFVELRQLFEEFDIHEQELEYSDFDQPLGYKGSFFPIANGIIQAAELDEHLNQTKVITIEGEQIIKALDEFEAHIGSIKSHFNVFYKEFLMGRGTSMGGKRYLRRSQLIKYVNKRLKGFDMNAWKHMVSECADIDLSREFRSDDQRLPVPEKRVIRQILEDIDQTDTKDVGCRACGYDNCEDLAIAIAQGLAIPEMCNTYATRNRQNHIQSLKISNEKLAQAREALQESERIARKEKEAAREASEIVNSMLQKLPSMIVIIDQNLKVLQANQSFVEMLGEEAKEINEVVPGLAGADLKTLLPYNIYNLFTYVLSNNENITNRDLNHDNKILNISVFVIRKNKIVGAVIRDMSAPEVQKEEVVKRLTEAIDKNLNLVQQIGFILGEGAAETERMLNSIIESYKPGNRKQIE